MIEAMHTHVLPAAAKMAAAPEARFNSRETAEQVGISVAVLRAWGKKLPQIAPLKQAGGRYAYSDADIALLKRVKHFITQEGYTLKGVQHLLANAADKPADKTGNPSFTPYAHPLASAMAAPGLAMQGFDLGEAPLGVPQKNSLLTRISRKGKQGASPAAWEAMAHPAGAEIAIDAAAEQQLTFDLPEPILTMPAATLVRVAFANMLESETDTIDNAVVACPLMDSHPHPTSLLGEAVMVEKSLTEKPQNQAIPEAKKQALRGVLADLVALRLLLKQEAAVTA